MGARPVRSLRPPLRQGDAGQPVSILGAAVEDGLIATNPCSSRSVRAPAVDTELIIPWTAEQVAAVVAAHPIAYRAVPMVAAGTGLRQGEVFGLRVCDVDFLRRRLLVRQQVKLLDGRLTLAPPKGRKTREVPLADIVGVALAERLPARGDRRGTRIYHSRAGPVEPELLQPPHLEAGPAGRWPGGIEGERDARPAPPLRLRAS